VQLPEFQIKIILFYDLWKKHFYLQANRLKEGSQEVISDSPWVQKNIAIEKKKSLLMEIIAHTCI